MNNKELVNQTYENYKEIVEKISYIGCKKFTRNHKYIQEELSQLFWVSIVSAQLKSEKQLDDKLVVHICYNVLKDKLKYEYRRSETNISLSELTENCLNSNPSLKVSNFDSVNYNIEIQSLIELFPKLSKERKYIIIKLYKSGELDSSFNLLEEGIDSVPIKDNESDILPLLGYNSKYPGNWVTTKHSMVKKIYTHLGIIPELFDIDLHESLKIVIESLLKSTSRKYIELKEIRNNSIIRSFSNKLSDLVCAVNLSDILNLEEIESDYYVVKSL